MKFSHTYDGKTLIVYLKGDMDHHHITKFKSSVDDMINWYKPRVLKLDYANVHFMDSAGIGFILGRIKLMYEYDGEIVLTSTQKQVKKILELACIGKYAQII